MCRVEHKVIEVFELCSGESRSVCRQYNCARGRGAAHLVQLVANDFRVLVHDVLLHERCCLEQLFARLASELAVVLNLDVVLAETGQLAVLRGKEESDRQSGTRVRRSGNMTETYS